MRQLFARCFFLLSLRVFSTKSVVSVSDSVSAAFCRHAMAVTDDDRRAFITEQVSSDLQYVLQEADIALRNQYEITQHYRNLRVFAAMADDKTELRRALRTDFRLDAAADVATRAEVARVVTAWEMAKELASKEQELKAESKVMGMPRVLQHSERQAMLKAVEAALGKLQDSEVPSNEYLALKVEECEANEPQAATLDEVTSKQDTTTQSLQSSLDSAGHVRITKMKAKGKLPEGSEDLRRVLKIEAITWLCMTAKFRQKNWLAGMDLQAWLRYTDYVLGDRVFGLKVPVDGQQQLVRPSWTIVLNYEHRMRREAFKLVNSGQATLVEALQQVVRDADIKESFFTTPVALTAKSSNKWRRTDYKGDEKGKGGKGKGKGKSKKGDKSFNGSSLVSQTPDGREICFAYNAQGCRGSCGRVHSCRVRGCHKEHSAREHQKYAKKDDRQDE